MNPLFSEVTMISDKGWRIFMILMIVFAVLVFFNFPIGFSGKDYTSTIFSLSGSYYIRTFYDRPVDPEIDGVKYFYNQNGVNYTRSGKRIYIFGILVRDTTTVDPPLPESFKHDDELRDLISYVKTELKDSEFTKKSAIYSIYIYETEKSYSAEFNITGITTLEESNEAFLVFRRYLDEHPDYFLNEGYDLSLDMAGDVKVARNTYAHRTIEYSLNTSNPDDIRIKMSPGMIPEEIPEYSGFIDAKVVSVDSLKAKKQEEEYEILQEIYPDAEVSSADLT